MSVLLERGADLLETAIDCQFDPRGESRIESEEQLRHKISLSFLIGQFGEKPWKPLYFLPADPLLDRRYV
jgi:hypothetical protein